MILNLEDQCASLALCLKLKDLGAPQESYFQWVGDEVWDRVKQSDYEITGDTPPRSTWCAAYTVAELVALVPLNVRGLATEYPLKKPLVKLRIEHGDEVEIPFEKMRETSRFLAGIWSVDVPEDDCLVEGAGATLAEAIGLLLTALVERGVVKFEKVAT